MPNGKQFYYNVLKGRTPQGGAIPARWSWFLTGRLMAVIRMALDPFDMAKSRQAVV